jgi:outer membrane protein OmpA-like peptidoglycan-associated protein
MRFAAIAAAALIAAACAHLDDKPRGPELFAVIPHGADGHVGAIVVHRAGKTQVVNTAYGAQRIDEEGFRRASVTPEQVKADFAETLAALPGHPARFTLYFLEGRDELTPESQRELDRVFAELRNRPLPDIAVIGHTDTVGGMKYNDKLSLARAGRMRDILVELGLPAERITVAGRGKRELLVTTGENIGEPRNRRVEIDVR